MAKQKSGSKPTATGVSAESGNSGEDVPKYPQTDWTKADFLSECDLSEEDLADEDLSWEELAAIHDAHRASETELTPVASYIADRLRQVSEVHSVRTRIKSPAHLVRKILRKRRADPKREIGYTNYQEEVTDLVGLRALHLFKEEWKPVHDFICEHWELREKPIAYVRAGDNEAWLKAFQDAGCQVTEHPRQYRSIHYTIASAPSRQEVSAEIQVRTLFEEAWSEIDHRINYPTAVSFESIGFFLQIFNRLAGSADEMGSFINALLKDLKRRETEAGALATERDEAMQQVQGLVDDLEISDKERKRLKRALDAARAKEDLGESFTFRTGAVIGSSHFSGDEVFSVSIPSSSSYGIGSLYLGNKRCDRCGGEYSEPPGTISVSSTCPECRGKTL